MELFDDSLFGAVPDILVGLKDFIFPFVALASVVFIVWLTIKKFDFFRANCKWLGLEISAGRHDKSKRSSQNDNRVA